MIKREITIFIFMLTLFVAVTCFLSCNKETSLSGLDPEETVELTLGRIEWHDNMITSDGPLVYDIYSTYYVSWEAPNNITTTLFNAAYYFDFKNWAATQKFVGFGFLDVNGICCVGTVKGLGDITEIPASGYTNNVDCSPGYGYVICYTNPYTKDSPKTYARMYVIKQITNTSGDIIGAKVKCQYPFSVFDDEKTNQPPTIGKLHINRTKDDMPVSEKPQFSLIETKPRILVSPFDSIYYEVIATVNDEEYGFASGSGMYAENSVARIEAVANSCYPFSHWTIDGMTISTNPVYTFTVTEDVTVVANFYALDFDTYAPTLWNNTFMLNLKLLEMEGYDIIGCKWYKNGIEELNTRTIDEFSYSAGPDITDLLEPTPTWYKFELITSNHGNLCSTHKMLLTNF